MTVESREAVHVRVARNHMATTFEFVISCERGHAARAERLLLDAHSEVRRLEHELSEFGAESPVHVLNRLPAGTAVQFTADGIRLLELSMRLQAATGGAFDPTAKSTDTIRGPRILWDGDSRKVRRLTSGTRLSFGAIGKGYALDVVRALLEREGFNDFLLNAGGSSQILSGFSAFGKPWRWGWNWADSRGADDAPEGSAFRHDSGSPVAIGVSGLQEQGAHILDSRGGPRRPSRATLLSAFVARASAAESDALSTALFVSGWDAFHETVASSVLHGFFATAAIDLDGTPCWNGHFQQLWGSPALAETTPGEDVPEVPEAALAIPPRRIVHRLHRLIFPSGSAPSAVILAAFGALLLAATGRTAFAQEESIDLSELEGFDAFTPYMTERNPLWILLPLSILALVFLHLRRIRAPRKPEPKGTISP